MKALFKSGDIILDKDNKEEILVILVGPEKYKLIPKKKAQLGKASKAHAFEMSIKGVHDCYEPLNHLSPEAEKAVESAAVMEAEVASEGRAAKKPGVKAKKGDKRLTPKFIAHLRNLAQKRKEAAAAKRNSSEKSEKKASKKSSKPEKSTGPASSKKSVKKEEKYTLEQAFNLIQKMQKNRIPQGA